MNDIYVIFWISFDKKDSRREQICTDILTYVTCGAELCKLDERTVSSALQSSNRCRRFKIQIWRFLRAARPHSACALRRDSHSPRRVANAHPAPEPAGRPPQSPSPRPRSTLPRIRRRCSRTEAPMGPIRRSRKRKPEPEPPAHPAAPEAEARGGKPVRFLLRASERLRTPPQPRPAAPPTHQVRGRRRQRVPRRVYRFLADLSSSDAVIFFLSF